MNLNGKTIHLVVVVVEVIDVDVVVVEVVVVARVLVVLVEVVRVLVVLVAVDAGPLLCDEVFVVAVLLLAFFAARSCSASVVCCAPLFRLSGAPFCPFWSAFAFGALAFGAGVDEAETAPVAITVVLGAAISSTFTLESTNGFCPVRFVRFTFFPRRDARRPLLGVAVLVEVLESGASASSGSSAPSAAGAVPDSSASSAGGPVAGSSPLSAGAASAALPDGAVAATAFSFLGPLPSIRLLLRTVVDELAAAVVVALVDVRAGRVEEVEEGRPSRSRMLGVVVLCVVDVVGASVVEVCSVVVEVVVSLLEKLLDGIVEAVRILCTDAGLLLLVLVVDDALLSSGAFLTSSNPPVDVFSLLLPALPPGLLSTLFASRCVFRRRARSAISASRC